MIFIHIPKNAGQSIKAALGRQPEKFVNTTKASVHITRMGMGEFKSHFSFAFVRNPWARQVSFYYFIQKTKSHRLHALVKPLSFYEYITKVMQEYEIVYENQRDYIYVNNERMVDFVGRVENIQRDFRIVRARLRVTKHLEHRNATQHEHYPTYYCDTTREIVRRVFEADIDTFRYRYESI